MIKVKWLLRSHTADGKWHGASQSLAFWLEIRSLCFDSVNNSPFSFGGSLFIVPPTKSMQANGQLGRLCYVFSVFREGCGWVIKYSQIDLLCGMLSQQPRQGLLSPVYSGDTDSEILRNLPKGTLLVSNRQSWPACPQTTCCMAAGLASSKCRPCPLVGNPVPGWRWIYMTGTDHRSHLWSPPYWWWVSPASFPFTPASLLPSLPTRFVGGKTREPQLYRGEEQPLSLSLIRTCHFQQCLKGLTGSPEGFQQAAPPPPPAPWRKKLWSLHWRELFPRAKRCLLPALHTLSKPQAAAPHRNVWTRTLDFSQGFVDHNDL